MSEEFKACVSVSIVLVLIAVLGAVFFSNEKIVARQVEAELNAPIATTGNEIDFPFKPELGLRGSYNFKDKTVKILRIEPVKIISGGLIVNKFQITPDVKCADVADQPEAALLRETCATAREILQNLVISF